MNCLLTELHEQSNTPGIDECFGREGSRKSVLSVSIQRKLLVA